MPIKFDYKLAMAAARDAGNRSMIAGKRTAWSEEDRMEADRMFYLVYEVPADEQECEDRIAALRS